ncbi:MAG: hypothetical protein LBT39_01060 [Treponema sp.]|jgi:hypothetical protein|nr:hypothetical protein [Treponema sp.]
MQKKEFNGFGGFLLCGAVLTALISLGACKSAPPPPVEEKPIVGVIAFNDGLPDGPWAIYATQEQVSKFGDMENGMQKCSAYGAFTDAADGRVNLYDRQDLGEAYTGPAFNRDGTYTVIIATTDGTRYAFNPRVVFRDGEALISFAGMTNLTR